MCHRKTRKRCRSTYLQDVAAANAIKVRLLHLEQVIKRDTVVLSLKPNRHEVPAKPFPVLAHHTSTAARRTEVGARGTQQRNITSNTRKWGCQRAISTNSMSGCATSEKCSET